MQIYTGLCYSKRLMPYFRKYNLGMMISTSSSTWVRGWFDDFPLALDNGAYPAWRKAEAFPERDFLNTLDASIRCGLTFDFVICPDKVAAGIESLEFSLKWRDRLKAFPLALAVQDGMKPCHVAPFVRQFHRIFIGGTNRWKWQTARQWIELGERHSVKTHIGRCGSIDKLKHAKRIGATSVDSTNFIRNGVKPHWFDELRHPKQLELF